MPKLLAGFVAPPGKHGRFLEASCVRLGFDDIDCIERTQRYFDSVRMNGGVSGLSIEVSASLPFVLCSAGEV